MSDPIEKLNRLGDALEGAPMPLPASEIRARGDRIRRRKHAFVAGASAAVVAAVVVPVVAFTVGGSDDPPDIAPSPTVSDPVPAAPLSAENLLTSDDATYGTGGSVDWVASGTPSDGQRAFSPCAQSSLDALGAESVFQRDFDFVVTDTQEVDETNYLNEIIAEFPTAADAEAAYDEIRGWYADCLPEGADRYDEGTFDTVPIGVDGTAEAQLSDYGPVDESIDPFGDDGFFLETGLVLSGDRIAVVSQSIVGQDYNFAVDDRPVVRMLPVAAERLVLGSGSETEAPPVEGGDGPTEIPDNFPLAAGWPDDSEAEPEETGLEGPNRNLPALEFSACDETLPDPDHSDRLRANWTNVEDFRARQLTTYADADAAASATGDLADFYRSCGTGPVRDDGYRTEYEVVPVDAGDQAWAVLQRDTFDGAESPFGSTTVVVRTGAAVLILDHGGHAGYPSGDGQADIDQMLAEAAEPIAAMAGLQAPPSSSAEDFDDPAGTTTIPDGFPIDLALGEPPVEDSETLIDGPSGSTEGVRPQTACGTVLSLPGTSAAAKDVLGYTVAVIGGYDGRTIETHATVQDAIDRMRQLRAEIQGCDRDSEGDGLSDRLWESFSSDTGYDSMTFGWTYEETEFQGPTAGQLYTVVRVGNAILAIEWGSEGSAQSQVDSAPDQVELAQVIAEEMCLFQEAGC